MAQPFYPVKTLIDGYRIDPKFKGKVLIAVPEAKAKEKGVVRHGDAQMKVDPQMPVHRCFFRDKFGRNKIYELLYYEWRPEPLPKQLLLI